MCDAIESAAGQINVRDAIVEVATGLPTVYGERARLVEVVQNLIDNAVKYMGNQPHIEIGARAAATLCFGRQDSEISWISLQLRDKIGRAHV